MQCQADKAQQHALLLPHGGNRATDVGQNVAECVAAHGFGRFRLIQRRGYGAQQRQALGWQLRRPGFDGGDALCAQQLHQQARTGRIERA